MYIASYVHMYIRIIFWMADVCLHLGKTASLNTSKLFNDSHTMQSIITIYTEKFKEGVEITVCNKSKERKGITCQH